MPRTHRNPLAALVIALTLLGVGFLSLTSIQNHSSGEQGLQLMKDGLDKSTKNASSLDSAGADGVNDSTRMPTEVGKGVHARVGMEYGRLPLSFEVNQGQVDDDVKYLSHGNGYSLFLTPTEAVLALSWRETAGTSRAQAGEHKNDKTKDANAPQVVLHMKLVDANPSAEIRGVDEQSGKSNYFLGNDPAKWRTDVSQYARVRYSDVYPGVNLVYYGNQQQLEYDFEVAPGKDPRLIRLAFDGADQMRLNADGSLLLRARGGELLQRKPVIYQENNGERKEIDGRYILKGKREIGFEVEEYDRSKPLVIDPVLSYSTYLGGNFNDVGYGIAVDALGNAYITGVTSSIDFPTVNPLPSGRPEGAAYDFVFVSKLNAAGSALVYSTYLGGTSRETGHGIAVDRAGNAYITGVVSSPNFPVVNAYQPALKAVSDAFVTKLNPTGSALIYSTYLGGSAVDEGDSIAVDASGNAYITGRTVSDDFPTAKAAQAHCSGNSCGGNIPHWDAFVTKVNPSGSALVYSTFLGGERNEFGNGIAVDSTGNAYVTGFTTSVNFPTTPNVLQPEYSDKGTNSEEHDAFVTKLSPAGSFVYSTYLGGTRGSDDGEGIAVDSAGDAYVAGGTNSAEFPTVNAIQPTIGPGTNGSGAQLSDAFVSKVNSAGSALVYSTYIGGFSSDSAKAIALDSARNAYVTGYAGSKFPIVNPFQPHPIISGHDITAFVTKLNPTGSAFTYSAYLGGSGGAQVNSIALDSTGSAYVTGMTHSNDFPTINAFDATIGGTFWPDAFVTKISDNAQASSLSISSSQPLRGGNTGFVTVTVHGSAFANGATLKLVGAGQLDITAKSVTISHNSTVAEALFDLKGQAPGLRDVVLTNPDNASAMRVAAFTVEAGGEPFVWVDILGREGMRPGQPQTYYIYYGNRGNVDAYQVPLYIAFDKRMAWKRNFTIATPVLPSDVQPIDWTKAPITYEKGGLTYMPLRIIKIAPGGSGFLSLRLSLPDGWPRNESATFKIWAEPHPKSNVPPVVRPATPLVKGLIALHSSTSNRSRSDAQLPLSADEQDDCRTSVTRAGLSIGYAALGKITGECLTSAMSFWSGHELENSEDADSKVNSELESTVAVAAMAGNCSHIRATPLDALDIGLNIGSAIVDCTNVDEWLVHTILPIFGIDPNDKVGAPGVGTARYLSGEEPLRYAIYFENKPEATGAAQTVVVTDQLDASKLDFDTFNLGSIFFGADNKVILPSGLSEYAADVDLRPQQNIIVHVDAKLDKTTGLLTWRFTSLNPATGLPTDDPFAGFLPPNKTAPEGEAQVLFTVQTKKDIATGTEIRNKARIVFDNNDPIDTPEWLNTIDNSKPVSHVLPLAATQDSVIFNVNWAGTDTGSGVRSYTVLVSENGGSFTAWLSNTTVASGRFIGQPGKTYSFYSVAQDQTGNQENAKTSAEAVTTTTSSISNSIDDPQFFVRQHYLDFLNREPDASGLQFWTSEITSCGADAACREVKRINVSAAFFLSIEFQQTGYLAYLTHKAAFGNPPGKPVPITREEMLGDQQLVADGLVVGITGWEQKLERNKESYFDQFVASQRFTALYPQAMTAEQYIDALNSNVGGALSQAERDAFVNDLKANKKTRAQALRAIVEDPDLSKAETNKAFVLMQFFGYLRRNPDDAPDHDFGGWQFWLSKLDQFNGNFVQAEMVKAFLSSSEYRNRFVQ